MKRVRTMAAIVATSMLVASCSSDRRSDDLPVQPPFPSSSGLPGTTQAEPARDWYDVARIRVTNYCLCGAPRNQQQAKVKLEIENTTGSAMNASIENIRLLIPGNVLPIPGWSPKDPVTEPSVIRKDGAEYTAIPANANTSYELIEGAMTWASHWYASAVPAGWTYSDMSPGSGHIVFYFPQPTNNPPFSGIGIVTNDGQTLLGFEDLRMWPADESDPSTF